MYPSSHLPRKPDGKNNAEVIAYNQCTRKVPYKSLTEALDGAKAMKRKYKKKFQAYHCPWCGGFHVGTKYKPRFDKDARKRDLRK